MKRTGNLFEQVCTLDNLYLADVRAQRNKKKTKAIENHLANRDKNLKELQRQLIAGTFRTSEYRTFKIFAPKERIIHSLPYYPDRIVHHAIMNILEPIWVSVFSNDTYSCIKGRGIHKCANDLKQAIRHDPAGTVYSLKLDITKYYPSVDNEILKQIVRKKIKDKKLLALLDEIIDSETGIPIGNYLSQYFANLYLAYFDHWVKEELRVEHYFRYADDIVILSNSKEFLHRVRSAIEEYLWKELKLNVKSNWRVFPTSTGIDFVGYVFYPTHTRLRKGIKKNMFRYAMKLANRGIEPNKHNLSSWWGWCKYCNSINLLKTLKIQSEHEKSKITRAA